MNSKNFTDTPCPIARGLIGIGDAWSMLILRDASQGITRFDQFRTSLGIAPTILTKRLAVLTEEGLLEKRRYSERPPRDEYVLTPAGRDFLPVLLLVGAWGRKYRGGGALTRYVDEETGEDLQPVAIDAVNGSPVGSRPIKVIKPET